MTELCFRHCVCNLNYRLLTGREVSGARGGRTSGVPTPPDPIPSLSQESCLDSCAARLVRANHRLMGAYVGLMPALLQRRAAEHGVPAGLPASPEPAPDPAESAPDAPAAGT